MPLPAASGRIVSLGEAMVEFNQVRAGAPDFLQGFGGDTSNCLVAAARQGAPTAYVSAVGDDAFGAMLLSLWRDEGVDVRHVAVDRHAHTGVYFVTHDASGHQFSYLRAGSAASRLGPADLPADLFDGTAFLHVSGITQAISTTACDASFEAIRQARAREVPIAYDPNLRLRLWPLARARAVVRETVASADLLLISEDDAAALTAAPTPDEMLAVLLGWGARTVLLKRGAEGVLLHVDGRRETVPGHAVAAVDATGAGDCFAGAFLARLASGDDVLAATRYANAAAALSTLGHGAIAPIPRPVDVERLLASGG